MDYAHLLSQVWSCCNASETSWVGSSGWQEAALDNKFGLFIYQQDDAVCLWPISSGRHGMAGSFWYGKRYSSNDVPCFAAPSSWSFASIKLTFCLKSVWPLTFLAHVNLKDTVENWRAKHVSDVHSLLIHLWGYLYHAFTGHFTMGCASFWQHGH